MFFRDVIRVSGKPKKINFDYRRINLTRAGLSHNPLERFSFTGGTPFSNNALVKHGDRFFIGGDVATYEYTFELKQASSVAECPMRVLNINTNTLKVPTDTWGTTLENTQSFIDYIKVQGGTPLSRSSSVAGDIAQIMVELDLTPLCNSLFSGSNSALKSALKGINVDCYCQGSGSNGGVLTNGCGVAFYNTSWVDMNFNNTASIVKTTASTINTSYIQSSNKLYILIYSTKTSDGTIPSTVQLDYLNIKIDIAKSIDSVLPISVNLPKYWAMVVKGFSPNFDSTKSIGNNRIFSFYIDTNNRWSLMRMASGSFNFAKVKTGTMYFTGSSVQTFSKNQVYNFLIGQNSNGMFIYLLKNNGTIEKATNTNIDMLSGQMPLNILNQNGTEQGDSFLDSITLIDLERMGKSSGFTDSEALSILKGQMHIKENNLVVNGDFALDSNSDGIADNFNQNGSLTSKSVSNNTQYFTALSSFGGINNSLTGNGTDKYYVCALVKANSNLVQLRTQTPLVGKNHSGSGNFEYLSIISAITGTNSVRMIDTGTSGFTEVQIKNFNIINLTQLYGAGLEPSLATLDALFNQSTTNPIALTNPELFDINAVTLHTNATRSGGVITLNASALYQYSYIDIPVLPNNCYTFSIKQLNGRAKVIEFYNNINLNSVKVDKTVIGQYDFITSSNVNKIRVTLDNSVSATGTFTFSNISLKRRD